MIIALSGYARAGKDATGKILVDNHGFTRVSFADKIREFILAIDPIVGFDNEDVRLSGIVEALGWESAKAMPEVRRLLQNTGTEAGQYVLWKTIWAEATLGRYLNPLDYINRSIVITDFRFPHEGEVIKKLNGYTIRVRRPGVGPINKHGSETALQDCNWIFDQYLDNDSDLLTLETKVDTMLRTIYG